MSLLHHHNHHMHHFLEHKEMNAIYLSYGILNFAYGMIAVFVPIYLYKLDFPIPGILFYFFLMSLYFMAFSYTGARIVAKIGVKYSILATIPLIIAYLIGLRFLQGSVVLFFILPLLNAIKGVLYNYSFHLNFIEHADREHTGEEISLVHSSALAAGILSPFIGGFIIKFFGFDTLFAFGSILLFFSVFPLLAFKDKPRKMTFGRISLLKSVFEKSNLPLSLSFSGYAIEDWIGFVIWPVFLFIMLKTTESVGIISSIATGITFLILYFVGKMTDNRDRSKLLQLGTLMYFLGWIGRLFANSFLSVSLVDTYKSLSGHFLRIPWDAYSYNLASKSDYFKFIVQREITYNLSRVVIVPFLILVFIIDYHPFLISFSIAAAASLLYAVLEKAKTGGLEKETA